MTFFSDKIIIFDIFDSTSVLIVETSVRNGNKVANPLFFETSDLQNCLKRIKNQVIMLADRILFTVFEKKFVHLLQSQVTLMF